MNDYVPFPVGTLPPTVARFVRETAKAMQCDPAFVALPSLAILGGAIGTSREIKIKESWREPPIVWTCIIARSGTAKSPSQDAAVKPLADVEHSAQLENKAALTEYENRKLQYEKDLARWKSDKGGAVPMPEKPEPPRRKRYIVADTTLEALAPLIEENPRGLVMVRDELAAWVRGFNQYKGGKGGDAAAWLELHRAGRLSVDRKGDRKSIYVPRAAVSLCGTIQPGTFASAMRGEHFESGLTARLLIAQPPTYCKTFTLDAPSMATVEGYTKTVHSLAALEPVYEEDGPRPFALSMTPDALAAWSEWYGRHAKRQHEAGEDAEAAALAKLEAYAARFALIFALCRNPRGSEVSVEDIRRGCVLADWFANEAARLYCRLAEDDEAAELRKLVNWIERKGGSVTPRDLCRNLSAYATVRDAEIALDGLVQENVGAWLDPAPGPTGGRPSRVFVLHRVDRPDPVEPEYPIPDASADADETPDSAMETEVSSVSVESPGLSPSVQGSPDALSEDDEFEARKRRLIDVKAARGGGEAA